MKTRVFQFIKNVRHEPEPQYAPWKKGDIIIASPKAYEPKVISNHGREELSIITGHGSTDEFKIGEEVEELRGLAAAEVITERAMAKLSPDEREALRAVLEARLK